MKRLLADLAARVISGREPAIVAAVVNIGLGVAAHYSFNLSATEQLAFQAVVSALVAKVVRELVYPAKDVTLVD